MIIAIVAVKLAAVKVKSLDEIKVEKEKPAVVEDQAKNNDEVNTACVDTIYGKTFEGENFHGFHSFSLNCECFSHELWPC